MDLHKEVERLQAEICLIDMVNTKARDRKTVEDQRVKENMELHKEVERLQAEICLINLHRETERLRAKNKCLNDLY